MPDNHLVVMLHSDVGHNKRAANIWTARLMPFVLTAVVSYVTYVVVAILCGKQQKGRAAYRDKNSPLICPSPVNYLLVKRKDKGAAVPVLVIFFLLFIFMASSFFRVVYMTTIDPPYAPLGAGAARSQCRRKREDDIGGGEYTPRDFNASKDDPDSPGLELFYTKDVFGVERDGKPKWCSECCIWKLDRQHHCSVVGRCIYKMDHYCPWYVHYYPSRLCG